MADPKLDAFLKDFFKMYFNDEPEVLGQFPLPAEEMEFDDDDKLSVANKDEIDKMRMSRDFVFESYYYDLMNNGPILDEDGHIYPPGSQEKILGDLTEGKRISFMGIGKDGMVSIKPRDEIRNADPDAKQPDPHKRSNAFNAHYRVANGGSSGMGVEAFHFTYDKADWTPDMVPSQKGPIDPVKPSGGGFWNRVVKFFTGHPSQRWAAYERHQERVKLNKVVEVAKMNKNEKNFLSDENIEEAKKKAVAKFEKEQSKKALEAHKRDIEYKNLLDELAAKEMAEGPEAGQPQAPTQPVKEEPKSEVKAEPAKEEPKPEVKPEPAKEESKKEEPEPEEPEEESLAEKQRRKAEQARQAEKAKNQYKENRMTVANNFIADLTGKDFESKQVRKGGIPFKGLDDKRVNSMAYKFRASVGRLIKFSDNDAQPDYDVKKLSEDLANVYLGGRLINSADTKSSNMEKQDHINDYPEYEQIIRNYNDIAKRTAKVFEGTVAKKLMDDPSKVLDMVFDPEKSFTDKYDANLAKLDPTQQFERNIKGKDWMPGAEYDAMLKSQSEKVKTPDVQQVL